MNYQKLFNYMSKQHGVDLLETDMQEICNIVNEMQPTPTPEISAEAMLKHVLSHYANEKYAIIHLIHELQRVSIILEKIGADATYYKNALEYLKGR